MSFDPRLTPARPDLAAQHLEGKVQAERFVPGERREVIAAQAPLRRAPANDAPLETEVLIGEQVQVYETTAAGWAWGQLEADGYVGWLPPGCLAPPGPAATHRIAALRTFVFPGPSIKLPPIAALPFGGRAAVARTEGAFAITAKGGYVPAVHLAPAETREVDWVATAERFIGTPYLWGGKTNMGIDCSGLVQVVLRAAGIAAPRDSDMQQHALGEEVPISPDLRAVARGDLIFWSGHVAVVRDPGSMLHANAFHMAVVVEPLADAVARIAASGTEIVAIKRLAHPPA